MKPFLVLLLSGTVALSSVANDVPTGDDSTSAQPSISVPVLDPDDPAYIVQPGTGFDGVAEIFVGDGGGTGALMVTGRHVLTAAHLWDGGNQQIDPAEIIVTFYLPTGPVDFFAARYMLHPEYDEEDFDTNNDIAIIELDGEVPPEADRYEIYRGNDEVGQVTVKCGFGLRGTGFTGQDEDDPIATLRTGENRYDALGDALNEAFFTEIIPGSQLIFDFDNGNAANDASGVFLGSVDLGLGDREVNTTSGDSGGPSFINGQVAGVVSYGFSPFDFADSPVTDIDEETNSTFGEFSSDTRVSFFADWIDSVAGTSPPTAVLDYMLH